MKTMMHFMYKVSNQMVAEIERHADSGENLDPKNTFGKFSMEIVASCAFGVDAGSYSGEETEFLRNAKGFFSLTHKQQFLAVCTFIPIAKQIIDVFKIPVMSPKECRFSS
jgi:hypothetical protein